MAIIITFSKSITLNGIKPQQTTTRKGYQFLITTTASTENKEDLPVP